MSKLVKKLYLIKIMLQAKALVLIIYIRMFLHLLRKAYHKRRRKGRSVFTLKPVRLFSQKSIMTLFRLLKLVAVCFLIIIYITLFPCPYSFFSNDKPYFGDFSWSSLNQVRLSAGDFQENGRGGLEHYIPRLRLIEYIIEKGDTLWSISKKFDVDPDSIISSNFFTNVHSIREGDMILIPNIRGIFINVEEGDTIFNYSTKYKVPPDFIMEVNDLRSNSLAPGMRVFLPGVKYSTMERAYALGEAFEKPVRGRLTSRFGYRRDPFTGKRSFHTGIDIAYRYGTKVYAAREGRVIFTGINYGYGKTVIISHSFGYRTVYGHLSSIPVSRGQRLKKGEIIGFIGISGRSTGPHLHFEVWLNNRLINPLTQTNMTVR